jgi:ribose 5-phosphate isomerase A
LTADDEKRLAAEAAAELVESGMTVGLGTGSTVAHLLPALARRGLTDLRCVATSVATEDQARGLGIPVEDFDSLARLDIAIDGTDEVTPDGWLIKGGGGAHLREKIVAAAADRFVVIADSSKRLRPRLHPHPPRGRRRPTARDPAQPGRRPDRRLPRPRPRRSGDAGGAVGGRRRGRRPGPLPSGARQ